jgi:hypothetical protein
MIRARIALLAIKRFPLFFVLSDPSVLLAGL